ADQHAERRPVAGALARRTPPHEKSENVRGRTSPLLPTAIFSLEIRVLLFLQDVSPNVSPAHDATRYQRGPLVPVFPHQRAPEHVLNRIKSPLLYQLSYRVGRSKPRPGRDLDKVRYAPQGAALFRSMLRPATARSRLRGAAATDRTLVERMSRGDEGGFRD